MVTLITCVFQVMLDVAGHSDLCPVQNHDFHRANVPARCLFRIGPVLATDVCHVFCQRPIHGLVSRRRRATIWYIHISENEWDGSEWTDRQNLLFPYRDHRNLPSCQFDRLVKKSPALHRLQSKQLLWPSNARYQNRHSNISDSTLAIECHAMHVASQPLHCKIKCG